MIALVGVDNGDDNALIVMSNNIVIIIAAVIVIIAFIGIVVGGSIFVGVINLMIGCSWGAPP